MGSRCIVDFVAPSVDDWLAIDVVDEGQQSFLEFVFRVDADVAERVSLGSGRRAKPWRNDPLLYGPGNSFMLVLPLRKTIAHGMYILAHKT